MIIKSLQWKLPLALLFLVACGSSSSSKDASGADGGPAAPDGGDGDDAAAAMDMGSVPFTVVEPCATAAAYTEGATTITFPNADSSYAPKCLKIAAGDAVTFMSTTGTFSLHPLEASRRRGDTLNNPITTTQSSTASRAFTFSVSGFYAYYCSVHGSDVDGTGMSGVVWVE